MFFPYNVWQLNAPEFIISPCTKLQIKCVINAAVKTRAILFVIFFWKVKLMILRLCFCPIRFFWPPREIISNDQFYSKFVLRLAKFLLVIQKNDVLLTFAVRHTTNFVPNLFHDPNVTGPDSI